MSSSGSDVDSVLVATEPATQTGRQRIRRLSRAEWLVLAGFLLAAFWATYHIWASPGTMAPSFNAVVKNDIYLNVWFMRYVATALAHGHLPALITTAVNAPEGINAMWNTSLFVPGAVLAPVTLLFGPVVSLAILLTLGFAGSAASMFLVLRRWDVSVPAATLGGALYAFMPALIVASEDHYHLQFAVLPPLIVDAALRIATGRSRPLRGGVWLGALITIQIFIAEELLVDTALAGGLILVILFLCRPSAALSKLGAAVKGLGIAAGVVLVICAYPLWIQFHGPLTEHGSPWHTAQYGNHGQTFVTAPMNVVWHSTATFLKLLRDTGQWPAEVYGYIGWPLLFAMFLIPVIFWTDLRIRVMSLSWLGMEWLSMGGHQQHIGQSHIPAALFPWHYLAHLPLLDQLVVTRLSIMADGLAAVTLALTAERVIALIRQQDERRKPVFAVAAGLALLAILVPIIPRPVMAAKIAPPPPGWTAVIKGMHLPANAPVLVLPLAQARPMEWQATTNEPISLVGGYCVAPATNGQAIQCDNNDLQTPAQQLVKFRVEHMASRHSHSKGLDFATFVIALRQWKAAAVVIRPDQSPKLTNYMLSFFGRPTAARHGTLGWRLTGQWWLHLPWVTHPSKQ